MASTLDSTTFKVLIKEEHIVKNVRTLNETTYTLDNITNVDRRIVTCPNTTSIDLFNVDGVDPGAGTFPSSSLSYVRITNLDDTYNLVVTLSSSNDEYWSQQVLPTSSFMWADAAVTGSKFDGSLGSKLEAVKVYAVSSSIDVEYVLVNS